MEGTMFACALMVMVAATVCMLKEYGRRPGIGAVIGGLLFACVLFAVLKILTPVHMCQRGGSDAPLILAAILSGVVLAAAADKAMKWLSITALIVAGFALTIWAMDIVHAPGYVGNRDWPQILEGSYNKAKLHNAGEMLDVVAFEHPDAVLKPGWIEESLQDVTTNDYFGQQPGCSSGTIGYFWHSWFSRIYRIDERWQGIWCAGGPITECAEKLEFREREKPGRDAWQ